MSFALMQLVDSTLGRHLARWVLADTVTRWSISRHAGGVKAMVETTVQGQRFGVTKAWGTAQLEDVHNLFDALDLDVSQMLKELYQRYQKDVARW